MAYISSNENRFYVALETAYGSIGASQAPSRIPAVKLATRQRRERMNRKDKTGSRTFLGAPEGVRKTSTFELRTYLTDWQDKSRAPGYGPLFQACLGGQPLIAGARAISAAVGATGIAFSAAHGLTPGQAISYGAEIRFVAAVVNSQTVQVNAPFSIAPASGTSTSPTTSFLPANELASATIFDYWSPGSAVQRVVSGAGIDELQMKINGDLHEFQFSGPACDILDSATFEAGQGSLAAFPEEPQAADFDYAIVPGHLGQVWLGSAPEQFFTLTQGTLTISNNLKLRDREFGSMLARGISPGIRTVSLDFSVYQQDDAQTRALYQAARQNSPISVMIQLGQQGGQLAAVYLRSVILETPEFDDSEPRQQWTFKNCRAQGAVDDEIAIAFA